jgi:hypothetical protein
MNVIEQKSRDVFSRQQCRVLIASCRLSSPPETATRTVESNLGMMLETLENAAPYQPHIICFPEIVLHQGWPMSEMMGLAQPVPGLATEQVARKARALNSHVVFCLLECDGERIYNTAVLITPDGEIGGKYRKYQPTSYEMKGGIAPGESISVWETAVGRIGCAICFDLKFPEVGLALARGDARLVLWPSMFHGGRRLTSWAMDYGFYMARSHGASGSIVSPTGQVVSEPGATLALPRSNALISWCFAVLNLDHRTYHLDFHEEKIKAIQAKYGPGIELSYLREEGIFHLASRMPGLSIEQLEREFEMKPLRTYLDEATATRLGHMERRRS